MPALSPSSFARYAPSYACFHRRWVLNISDNFVVLRAVRWDIANVHHDKLRQNLPVVAFSIERRITSRQMASLIYDVCALSISAASWSATTRISLIIVLVCSLIFVDVAQGWLQNLRVTNTLSLPQYLIMSRKYINTFERDNMAYFQYQLAPLNLFEKLLVWYLVLPLRVHLHW